MSLWLPFWMSGLVIASLVAIGSWTFTVARSGPRAFRLSKPTWWLSLYGAVLLAIGASYVLGFSVERWWWLTREGTMVEWTTVWLNLFASVGFGLVAWRSRRAGQINLLALGGAALAFFIAGEELAWGQHVFHFSPPEAVTSVNTQSELTVHNLRLGGVDLVVLMQAFGPVSVAGGLLLWHHLSPETFRARTGIVLRPRLAGLLLLLSGYLLISGYPFPEITDPVALSEIPDAMFSRHSPPQSELSESVFGGALLFGSVALIRLGRSAERGG